MDYFDKFKKKNICRIRFDIDSISIALDEYE